MAAFVSRVGAHGGFTTTEKTAGLLDIAEGSSGSVWVYVQASGAIDQYDVVTIDEDGTARAITDAVAAAGDGHRVGAAQVAFADNEYGWVAVAGSDVKVNVAASCNADALLWTTAVAGTLDDASASAGNITIRGIATVTTATASGAQAEEAILNYPMIMIGT